MSYYLTSSRTIIHGLVARALSLRWVGKPRPCMHARWNASAEPRIIKTERGLETAILLVGECRTLWGERERVHAGAEFAWNSCMTLC